MPGASPQNKIKFFIPNDRWSEPPGIVSGAFAGSGRHLTSST